MPNQDLGSLTMLGAASMPAPTLGLFEYLASSMLANSSTSAGLTASYAVSAAPQGDSSLASNAALLLAVQAGMVGDSSGTIAGAVSYAEAASLLADSSMTADAFEFDAETLDITADSTFVSNLSVLRGFLAQLSGNSVFFIDPAGVVVTKITKGPPIPATAKPPTVPQLRVTPPAPGAPSYSVSTSPPRRTPR